MRIKARVAAERGRTEQICKELLNTAKSVGSAANPATAAQKEMYLGYHKGARAKARQRELREQAEEKAVQDAEPTALLIQATSAGFESGNAATIVINHVPITLQNNENGHDRGLHIVLVNPADAKVEFAKVFDTHESSQHLDNFIATGVPDGHIVVAACKDECFTNISESAKKWFTDMGSKEINNLKYREGFAFIGINGEVFANEMRGGNTKDGVEVTQIFERQEDEAAGDDEEEPQRLSVMNANTGEGEGIYQDECGEAVFSTHDQLESTSGDVITFSAAVPGARIVITQETNADDGTVVKEVKSMTAQVIIGKYTESLSLQGGNRYSINSSKLNFVPKQELTDEERETYGFKLEEPQAADSKKQEQEGVYRSTRTKEVMYTSKDDPSAYTGKDPVEFLSKYELSKTQRAMYGFDLDMKQKREGGMKTAFFDLMAQEVGKDGVLEEN